MSTLQERINYAARVIGQSGNTSRKFDNCFEEGDGDKVVAALVARSKKNQTLRVNLPRYVSPLSILKAEGTK